MASKQFYERIKGPMNNYEDWYSYRVENDEIVVTHTWSHVSPSLSANHGSKDYTFDEFQKSSDIDTAAKIALDHELNSKR